MLSLNFDNEHFVAFDRLDKALCNAPIIQLPIWDLPFELMCDASDYVGAVLCQKNDHC